ncbi:MAG: serine/threonine protein kinase [Armatimonadetes bacterium]|nr:serine/threonine protein kinase [Armatimonadota bacterium]
MVCSTCAAENPADRSACRICGAPLSERVEKDEALPSGTRLAEGAYVLEALLGRGGLGITYRAWDTRLQRQVAIKEFFPEGSRRAEAGVQPPADWSGEEFESARQQFVAEGQLLARFTQRGIAQAYYTFQERGTAYLVLEYVRGETLAERLRREGPLPVDEVVSLGEEVLLALEEVHGAGVVHGDIKPENLLLCGDGRVVLVDFGSARGSDGSGRKGVWVTPAYAPLEQYAKTAPLGPYTDLYGLGATLYHALVGAPPPGAPERAKGVRLRGPLEVRPEVTRGLSEAICRALAMEVRQRPGSAAEFAAALRRGLPAAPGQSDPALEASAWSSSPWKNASSPSGRALRGVGWPLRALAAFAAIVALLPLVAGLMIGVVSWGRFGGREAAFPTGEAYNPPPVLAIEPTLSRVTWDGRRPIRVQWRIFAPVEAELPSAAWVSGEWSGMDAVPGWPAGEGASSAVTLPPGRMVTHRFYIPPGVLAQARQRGDKSVYYRLTVKIPDASGGSAWQAATAGMASVRITLPPRAVLDQILRPCVSCRGLASRYQPTPPARRPCEGECGSEGWLLRCPICGGDGQVSAADRRALDPQERWLADPSGRCTLCHATGWVRGADLAWCEERINNPHPPVDPPSGLGPRLRRRAGRGPVG